MEVSKIQSANKYVDRNITIQQKNVPANESGNADKANVQIKINDGKLENLNDLSYSPNEATRPVTTSITFSIERELNIIITKVIDGTSKNVLRQIPSEEVVKKRKLMEIYNQTIAAIGSLLDTVVE